MRKKPVEKKDKYQQATSLLYQVWLGIEWDKLSSLRLMKIYDEYASKIKSAACTDSLRHFVERLCNKMGVRSMNDSQSVCEILSENSQDILDAFREETQYLILLLREIIEKKKQAREETMQGIDFALLGKSDSVDQPEKENKEEEDHD